MKYLPAWFPGGGFKRTAESWKFWASAMADIPYSFVQKQMAEKKHRPSYLSETIDTGNIKPGSEEEFVAKWSTAAIYAGGSSTVSEFRNPQRVMVRTRVTDELQQ